jgi:hypothetical protein
LDGWGDSSTEASYCTEPGTGYADQGGDCDELDNAVNPGETEVCNDWVDNDCDGTDNGCTPSGTLSADDADVVILATSDSEWLGWSLAAGLISPSGNQSLICGSVKADDNGSNAGAAYVFNGATSATDASDANHSLYYEAGSDTNAGRGIAIGDLDGDGQDDVVLGAYGDNGVVIFLGPTIGSSPSYDIWITNDSGTDTQFGIEVAVGDLDGDGSDDLAIGAIKHTNSSSSGSGQDGAVYIFYGPLTDGILAETDADAVLEAPEGGGQAGGWLRFVGDVLGTGTDTLAIGAKEDDTNATNAGAVYLVTGAHSGTVDLATASAIVLGAADGDFLWHAAPAGDLNGDGNDDLILGAYADDTTATNGGALYAFYGPVAGTLSAADSDFKIYGAITGGGLGYDVASAGDVNGDGEIDLIVGAPYKNTAGDLVGQAYLFYGPFSGDLSSSDAGLIIQAGTNSDFLGGAVLGVGDLNSDGYDDFAFGDYAEDSIVTDGGACYIHYGGGI